MAKANRLTICDFKTTVSGEDFGNHRSVHWSSEPHPTLPLIFVKFDSSLLQERGCRVSATTKSYWGEVP